MVEFGTTQSLEESNMLQVPAQAEPSQQQSLSIAGETPEPVINQADANAAEVGRIQKASDQSARSRTAAQDLVLKRLRILNKKIQRFRSYQGGSNLNADQKAGLASLPGLEAAAKELEDLASGLEAIAKEESAKDEAARLAAESDLRNAAESAVDVYKETCLPLLTALVRVHATLRPSSSPSSNFMASDLPLALQSLSRPDVEVVDELFGLLKVGDAQGVIERIQLLKPTPIGKVLHRGDASTAESSGSTPVFSPQPLATISLPTEGSYAVPDVVQNDNELDSFRFQPEVAEQPVGRNIQPTKPAQPEMSFIQSSELVEGEVVNRNPPVEEPPVTMVEERVEPPSVPENKTTHEKKAPHSQPNIAKIVGLNWADDDEDHSGEEELARIRAQFNMPPLASASSDTARDKPSIAAGGPAPLPALAATKSSSPLPTSETPMIAQSHARTVQPPPEIPPQSNKSRSNARSASGASTNISQQCQNNAPTIGRGRGRGGFHQAGKPHIKPAEPEPAMEDDGFQIATRRRGPPVHQARGTIHNGRGGNRGSMANRQNGPQRRQG